MVRDIVIESINAVSATPMRPEEFADTMVIGDCAFATSALREFVRLIGGESNSNLFIVAAPDSSRDVTLGMLLGICLFQKEIVEKSRRVQ